MSGSADNKPVIGFSCGDINGIGIELIIKVLGDNRVLDICTPVVFGNNKAINFYRKTIPETNLNFSIIKDLTKVNHKQVNLFHCWEEEVNITPGIMNDIGGKYAVLSLRAAAEALKAGKINGLVTAPVHKKNIQSADFNFTGHTPYLKHLFGAQDVAMLMVAENMRIGLLTEHVPVKDIAQHITKESIISKLNVINQSLRRDFCITKPRIAVLGLNPHSGDNGVIGQEEEKIIKPALKKLFEAGNMVFGPFPADGFFGSAQYEKYDAVIATYHDQGLIPFKTLSFGNGVNYTAGLNKIRTSPDHGTAYEIAGKGVANHESFKEAVYLAIDIFKKRNDYQELIKNPLKAKEKQL